MQRAATGRHVEFQKQQFDSLVFASHKRPPAAQSRTVATRVARCHQLALPVMRAAAKSGGAVGARTPSIGVVPEALLVVTLQPLNLTASKASQSTRNGIRY